MDLDTVFKRVFGDDEPERLGSGIQTRSLRVMSNKRSGRSPQAAKG